MATYSPEQKREIEKGIESGINISAYANPEVEAKDMYQIRCALEDGINIAPYMNPKLDSMQIYAIIVGVKNGIDVSSFAKPEIPYEEMKRRINEINKKKKEAAYHKLKVKEFDKLTAKTQAKTKYYQGYTYKGKVYTYKQIGLIQKGLKEGLDISWYEDPRFIPECMLLIMEGLREGLQVSLYAKQSFSVSQMEIILKGLKRGLDVTIYANPDFSIKQMNYLYDKLIKHHRDSAPVLTNKKPKVSLASERSLGSKKDTKRVACKEFNARHDRVSNAVRKMRVDL